MNSRERLVAGMWAAGAAIIGAWLGGSGSDSARAHVSRSAADHPIAVCAMPMIVNELMSSERYKPIRDKMQQEAEAELQPLVEKARQLAQELQQMQGDDPRGQSLFEEYQKLGGEIRQKQAELSAKLEQLSAQQITECYSEVRASASAVAEDLGYKYVISSIGKDEELSKDSVETVLRQMLSRPVIMAPEEADITEDVREDLKLE